LHLVDLAKNTAKEEMNIIYMAANIPSMFVLPQNVKS